MRLDPITNNPLMRVDSYKVTHHKMLAPGTQYLYSYLESRGCDYEVPLDDIVWFGLQYKLVTFIHELEAALFGGIGEDFINAAEHYITEHIGPGIFNRAGWEHILQLGRLPLCIKALPEGTVVPQHTPLMTIVNTDPDSAWLTNWVETELLHVWAPTTTATVSRKVKQILQTYLQHTGCDLDKLDFMLHDFGYRGASSRETAMVNGMAHLLNFKGTDTMVALQGMRAYYGAREMPAFSVPASEHSVMSSLGPDGELKMIERLLYQYPTGILSIVIDTYDTLRAVEYLAKFEEEIAQRDGLVVVRPDSGDPASTTLLVVEKVAGLFGWKINDSNFKELTGKVRVLWGDGIGPDGVQDVLSTLHRNGWAANVMACFGMGGGLLQKQNRDTLKFAIKCTAQFRDGEWHDIWKDPVTDTGKASRRGLLFVQRDVLGTVVTTGDPDYIMADQPGDMLEIVYRDGIMLSQHTNTLSQMRERAAL